MEYFGLTGREKWLQELPPFQSRFPWLGGDLQTIRNVLRGKPELAADSYHHAPIDNGEQDLAVAINQPADMGSGGCQRLLLLVHGLGGNDTSSYMVRTARYFIAQGWTVARINCRGVGASATSSFAPYCGGLTQDIRDVINSLQQAYQPENFHAIGYSLGGHMLLRMIGEDGATDHLNSAVTVSAPLHLGRSEKAISRVRNRPYQRYVFKQMLRDFQPGPKAKVTKPLSSYGRIRDFDEYLIAPTFGFKDADDYYDQVAAKDVIGHIQQPVLAIHAVSDSWIPHSCYREADWGGGASAMLLNDGGHVGFHTAGIEEPWYDKAALVFFDRHKAGYS